MSKAIQLKHLSLKVHIDKLVSGQASNRVSVSVGKNKKKKDRMRYRTGYEI